MPTQQEIAAHLGMTQQAVSAQMDRLAIDWRNASMDVIRLAYIENLRAQASGHRSESGLDLTQERALSERIDRELKELTLAERKGQLVNVSQLESELTNMVVAFRSELLARDDKLKEDLDALYGIDVDRSVIEEHTRAALEHFARYDPGSQVIDPSAGGSCEATEEVDDDGLGDGAQVPVGQGSGQTG
ncbi:MAG TPA: MarR family transcriptional regulator [Aquabacterium sp.]|nr:MarR family transcriptional regulator [Aquabacterium sp.]